MVAGDGFTLDVVEARLLREAVRVSSSPRSATYPGRVALRTLEVIAQITWADPSTTLSTSQIRTLARFLDKVVEAMLAEPGDDANLLPRFSSLARRADDALGDRGAW